MIRIGQRLKEERLKKGLSLDDVSQATKIRPSFLAAIEKGEYNKLPSSSYALGFVQNYAEYLGLAKKETLALFRREFDEEKVYKVLPSSFAKKESMPKRSFKVSQAILPVILIVILLGGFLFYQYRAAFFNPPLTVYTPQEGKVTSSDITVTGKTNSNVTLTINNSPVAIEDDGSFSKIITTFPGNLKLIIRALNKFGKESVIIRNVKVSSSP